MTVSTPLLSMSGNASRERKLQENEQRIDEYGRIFNRRHAWISCLSTVLCPITCCLKNTVCCCCVCCQHQSVRKIDLCWHALNSNNAYCNIQDNYSYLDPSKIYLLKHEKQERDRLIEENERIRGEINQAKEEEWLRKEREKAAEEKKRVRDETAWECRLAYEKALSKQKVDLKYHMGPSNQKEPYSYLFGDPLKPSWWKY